MSRLDNEYGKLWELVQKRQRLGPEGRATPRFEPLRKSAKTYEPSEHLKGHLAADGAGLEESSRSNDAFELAFQRHLEKLSEGEQHAFRSAFYKITPTEILQKVKDFDTDHNRKSSFRKRIQPVDRFLKLLDQFMQGVAMGIQSQPDISSIVVGAVRVIIDLAVKFVTFWNKLSEMLCEFTEWLEILQQLSTVCRHKRNGVLQKALANVYGDLLDFCTNARAVFVGADGHPRKWASIRVFIQVQWKPFEDYFGGIKARVSKSLNNVHLAAQADALDNQEETLEKIKEMLHDATDRYALEQRRRFLKWVSEINPEESHDRILEKTYPGTAEWLTTRGKFQEWFTSPGSSALWCHGKAGMGKSVLASNVLDYISTQYALSDDVGIAFVYCNFADTKTQEPKQLISTFMKQLCWKKKQLPKHLLGFFQEYHGEARVPNLHTWKDQFWKLAGLFKEVYIVVDGLDECQEDARGQTLKFLLDPLQGPEKNLTGVKNGEMESSLASNGLEVAPRVALKVIVFSRNEADIAKRFQEQVSLTIQMDNEDVAPDIAAFVQGEIECRIQGGELRIRNQTLKSRVIGKLTAEADGMFLWPKLQLDTICREKTERDVEQALGNLPQDLKDTYSRMLRRINVQTTSLRELAYRCFRFVLYARRPLRIEEFRDAVGMIAPVASRRDLNLYQEADILDACGGFFVVESASLFIRPIHISIWSFLEDHFRDMDGRYVLDRAVSQRELAIACTLYLQLDFPKNGPCQDPQELYRTIQGHPFCFYASQNFDYHIAMIPESYLDLVPFFNRLLAGPERPADEDPTYDRGNHANRAIAAILQLRLLRNPFNLLEIRDGFDKNSYPVNPATMLYATQLQGVRWLTREARWPLPRAIPTIHSVSAAGRVDILMELIKKKVHVNEEDKYGVQPLYYACLHDHYTLASILVANKANVNHINNKGHALYVAASKGFSTIVRMLLYSHADPNLPGGHFGSALVAACNGGKVETVQILLSRNAAVESTPEARFFALHEAILSGRASLVELLLSSGADVNETVKEKAALLVATETQRMDIVRLLLDRRPDMNAAHPAHGTALHIAIRKSREIHGETKLAELLLQNGANVSGTENWEPALHAAVEVGSKEMVQLLLTYHADINEVAENGATALSLASKEGLNEIAQLLLDHGASLRAGGAAALEWAALGAHVDMVRWLLDHGVDVNEGHALEFAVTSVGAEEFKDMRNLLKMRRIEEIIGLLLDRGSSHGPEAFMFASAVGNKRIVELLKARGFEEDFEVAHLDPRDDCGGGGGGKHSVLVSERSLNRSQLAVS